MTINLNIKANVNNLTLSEIYTLLEKYTLSKTKDKKVFEYKGFKFEIVVDIDMSINYTINEIE